MKLFLSSHNFGNFASVLKAMVGDNRKTLVVTNARDNLSPAEREAKVAEKLAIFREQGFEAEELDLRPYFSRRPEELSQYVKKRNPGLIFCVGGDIFLLATALNISGMDDIIRRRAESGQSVYGGSSAGAIVAADDIEIYERDELEVETIPAYYGVEAVTAGLGLISEYIVPHMDTEMFADRTNFYVNQLQKIHADQIHLNDPDVYIIDGDHKEIKRG